MSRNIVFEGWLTKSPPTKRIWRTKWRKRWFALRQSGELPGQYLLDYYADRNYRRLKGTINLDLCEQVDAGLHMERTGLGSLDPKLRGSVFTIQTQSRIYHLEADSESDMARWVDAICRVCGLRAANDNDDAGIYQAVNTSNMAKSTEGSVAAVSGGPYIPISECITGVRSKASKRFTFDQKDIDSSANSSIDGGDERDPMYLTHHQIQIHHVDSENESAVSDDECKSLDAIQSNIRAYPAAKSFTKTALYANTPGTSEGPPVPPRPPKTFAMSRELSQRDPSMASYYIPNIQELENVDLQLQALRLARRLAQGASPSLLRNQFNPGLFQIIEEEDFPPIHQYCNVAFLPPAVDRNLKPRLNSFGTISGQSSEPRADTLQYLDLDLTPMSSSEGGKKVGGKKVTFIHGKSDSADEECIYNTVDFVKTEAFNMTMQDAEALRSSHN